MSKIFNRGLFIGGDPKHIATLTITVVDENLKGIVRCFGTTMPVDGTAGYAPGCLFWKSSGGSTGSTMYVNEGSRTSCDFNAVAGGGGAIGNFSLDDAYDDGATVAVDGGAVDFAGVHATNNVVAISGSGSGNLIDITNTGSGKDIDGTSSTWSVTRLGAAIFKASVTTAAIVGYAAGADCNMTIDAKGAGTMTICGTSTGAITLTRAVTCGSTLTVTGGADADAFIITAGDVLISDGHLTMVQPDNESSIVITAAGTTSGSVVDITATALTTGAILKLTVNTTATGEYINCYDGAAVDFKVSRYGAVTIAGNAAATASLTMTAGDLVLTSGHAILTAGNLTLTLGNILATAGNITATLGNIVATQGNLTVTAGATALTQAANSAALTVVNNTITTGNSLVEVTSTTLTTGAMMRINANTITHDAEILELISAGDATSTPIGLSITIPDVTTGVAKGILLDMTKATTQSVGITVDMAALTTSTGMLITTAGVAVLGGNLLTLTANAATTAAGLLRINANGLTSGIGLVITSSTTLLTGAGRLLRVDHTGNAGDASGIVAEVASAAADETIVMKVTASAANALGKALFVSTATTTGNGIQVTANALTDGFGISIDSSATTLTATGRLLLVTHSGNGGTSAVLAEIISAAADETVMFQLTASAALAAGYGMKISATAMTTGTALYITATGGTITTNGLYFNCYDATTSVSAFKIGRYGATTIAGSAVGTAALTITAGDVILTDGTLIFKEKTEVVAAVNAIGVAETGTTFFLNDATEFVSTLPAPAAGLHYKFIITGAPAGANYTIVTTGGTDLIHGVVCSAEDAAGNVDGTIGTPADTITFVASKALVGDWVEVVSDGTYWYAQGGCGVQDAITFTQT